MPIPFPADPKKFLDTVKIVAEELTQTSDDPKTLSDAEARVLEDVRLGFEKTELLLHHKVAAHNSSHPEQPISMGIFEQNILTFHMHEGPLKGGFFDSDNLEMVFAATAELTTIPKSKNSCYVKIIIDQHGKIYVGFIHDFGNVVLQELSYSPGGTPRWPGGRRHRDDQSYTRPLI
ncbi:MAG: hypothetical protein EB059_03740 [Alphaproteobacteria bacterium]|nr:hypothetical protein [Alphaproteobacteria bacterium]